MMATNPVVLLIPGSFSPSNLYTTTVDTIRSAGYEVHAYDLPSSARKPPQKSADMYEDAAFFREKAHGILNSGRNVVLLSHSYGGVVASETLKGLPTDPKDGPAVVGLVALTSLLLPVGVSLKAGMGELPSFLREEGEYMSMDPEGCAGINFSDLPHQQGVEAAKKLSMHSVSSFGNELTHAGYWDVPVAYIKCTKDNVVPAEGQQGMIDFVSKDGAHPVKVYELESGHCPNASQPEALGKLFVTAIEGLA